MKVAILGAGIGGLTAAITLQKKQIPYEIFESSPHFEPLGVGIWLAPNAMQCLHLLGLHDAIVTAGMPIRRILVMDKVGRPIQILQADLFKQRYGYPVVSILRSSLQKLLLSAILPQNLHMGKHSIQLEQTKSEVRLLFSDGSASSSNLVIAADGIHSKVRQQLFPASIARKKSIEQIFHEYENSRKQRANRILRRSFHLGKISSIKRPWVATLRDGFLRTLPHRIQEREFDWLFQLPWLRKELTIPPIPFIPDLGETK